MKVMVLGKATAQSEAGEFGTPDEFVAMDQYNEKLAEAGIVLAGGGLQPTSKGKRVTIDANGNATVIDGPFAETKELVAGFWLWQVKSKAEAIEWLKRAPFKEGEVEIRQVFENEDFGEALTPELKAREERLREQVQKQAPSR